MISNINHIKSPKSKEKKSESLFNNVKEAVNNVINPSTWKHIKDITAATLAALLLFPSCHDDLDTTPPRIDVIQKNIEISWWEALRVNGNQVYIWNTLVFRCSDDVSENPTKSFTFSWNPISPWYSFDKSGSISMKATDEAWNVSNAATSQVNKKEVIDEIKCSLHKSEVSISKWDKITRNGKEIFVWSEKIFAWDSDDYAFSINFGDNKNIQLPYTIENSGDITFTLTNKWKSGTWTTKVTIDEVDNNKSPEITRKYPEDKTPNILWWVTVNMKNNQLLFWNTVMYEWKDDNTETCTPFLNVKWNTEKIKTWETIKDWGTLSYTLTDEKWKSTSVEFSIESKGIDLTNLNSLSMQVGQETDLLKWISIPSGIQVSKVEVETNWQRQEIKGNNGHYLYTPTQPWTCYIYVTQKWEFWNTYVEKSKNPLTIKDIEHPEYQSINITNIKPVDILPIIWQVESWDGYSPIEHLRIAETSRIRDMMWKYGTGSYSKEEYQALMSRLNTGMLRENPKWYDNYEIIWWVLENSPSDHAHAERFILNTLIKHANFKIINSPFNRDDLFSFCKSNPNKINIIWLSKWVDVNKVQYQARHEEKMQEYDKEKNRLVFCAWWNLGEEDGALKNKVYQEDYELPDNNSVYWERSRAHNKNDNVLDRHLMVTFGVNKNWNIEQTNETAESSKFPVWFHDKILFSGRTFPSRTTTDWAIFTEWWRSNHWKYATSFTNYTNVALADLCFQMHADVKDVDELLDMIRSTALTDHIRFDLNGDWDTEDKIDGQPESQPLQLINPAWVFEKYCMIMDIPSSIKPWEIVTLNKWRYKWLVLNIAWTEVKINWQWVEYNKANESLIKSQNPMNLEQRINWDLVAKYSKNWSVKWKLIAVDDQWNGLNMEKDITINVK